MRELWRPRTELPDEAEAESFSLTGEAHSLQAWERHAVGETRFLLRSTAHLAQSLGFLSGRFSNSSPGSGMVWKRCPHLGQTFFCSL